MKLYSEFFDILENKKITPVFQPIVSLQNGEVIGYEALSRGPQGSALETPVKLFALAKELNKIKELDYLCRVKSIETFMQFNNNKLLFLNINPEIMTERASCFKQEMKNNLQINNLITDKIVLEITEQCSLNNTPQALDFLRDCLNQGFRLAIDDMGAGYANLNNLTKIRPGFVKLDLELIHGIQEDLLKQNLLKFLLYFSRTANITLIAEGIETLEQLTTLIDLGIEYGQGYYLQKPSSELTVLGLEERKEIINIKKRREDKEEKGINLEDIVTFNWQIDKRTNCKNIPLVVYYDTPLEKILDLAMDRLEKEIYDDLWYKSKDGKLGLLKIKDLIKKLTTQLGIFSSQFFFTH